MFTVRIRISCCGICFYSKAASYTLINHFLHIQIIQSFDSWLCSGWEGARFHFSQSDETDSFNNVVLQTSVVGYIQLEDRSRVILNTVKYECPPRSSGQWWRHPLLWSVGVIIHDTWVLNSALTNCCLLVGCGSEHGCCGLPLLFLPLHFMSDQVSRFPSSSLCQTEQPRSLAVLRSPKFQVHSGVVHVLQQAPRWGENRSGPLQLVEQCVVECVVCVSENCSICGIFRISVHCLTCLQGLCSECDRLYHSCPERSNHRRTAVKSSSSCKSQNGPR